MTPATERLRLFILDIAGLLSQTRDEAVILDIGGRFLGELVSHDDWLPEAFAQPDPARYRQYLLHCDSLERFSVVAFVWGPGQETPVHDHTVWGLIGLLRGCEVSQPYGHDAQGRLQALGAPVTLEPGQVEAVSPRIGDIHRVNNAFDDRVSISIHVYGANIGTVQRHVFADDGSRKPFISGYSNDWLPNLWSRA